MNYKIGGINYRRRGALARLELQLTKPQTETNEKRIIREIEILKTRV